MGQAYPTKQLSPLGPDYRTAPEPFTWPDLTPANDNVPKPANDNGPPVRRKKSGGPPRKPPKPPFGRKPPVIIKKPPGRVKIKMPGLDAIALGIEAAQYLEYWSKFKPANAPPGAFAAECLDGTFSFLGLGTTYCGPITWDDVQPGAAIVGVQDGFGFWNYQIHGYRMHEEGSVRLGTIFTWWTVTPDPWVEEYNRTSTGPMLVPKPNYTFWPNVDDDFPYESPLQTVPITTPSTSRPAWANGEAARGNTVPGRGFYPAADPTSRPETKPEPARPGFHPPPPGHPDDPPRNEVKKERKGTVKGGLAYGVINWVTEAGDFVDAIHDALPKDCRAKPVHVERPRSEKASYRGNAGWKKNGNHNGEWGYWRPPNDYERALAISNCFDRLDLGQALGNLVKNQIEDFIIGKIGKQVGKASRKSGRPVGFQAGPAL